MPDVAEIAGRLSEAQRRIEELEAALEPFARHIGREDALVTLKIGNDTWTGTLTGRDFTNASHILSKRNPAYRAWLASKGPSRPSLSGEQPCH